MRGFNYAGILQMRQDLKNLRRDNQRLTEANSTLERRVAGGRTNASSDQLWRYKEEVRWVELLCRRV